MICPSCPAQPLALFICKDSVYRCIDCKRSQPVPVQHRIGPTTSRFVKDIRRASGLCPRCGKPADGKFYCADHREEYRLACKARRERERA